MAEGSVMETIKEYLVSLGFQVDKTSFNSAKKVMDESEGMVKKFAKGAAGDFAIASAAVTTFAIVAVAGISKFMDSMGNAEIETEKLARQMWTTEGAARSFDLTLKAMNANLQDLYLSPTLMKQFYALRQEANQLALPADYKQTLGEIQSISFEFKRMKLEVSYYLREVAYYFVKYFNGPLMQGKKSLQDLNQWIIHHLPELAQKTAMVLAKIAQMAQEVFWGFKQIGTAISDLTSQIPNDLKPLVAIFAAVGLAIMSGPFGEITLTIGGILLLLDDFYVYLHGGKSALSGLWSSLDKLYAKLKDNGTISDLKTSFDDLWQSVDKSVKSINNLFTTFSDDKSKTDSITSFFKTIAGYVDDISKFIDRISNFLNNQSAKQKAVDKVVKAQSDGNGDQALKYDKNGNPELVKTHPSISDRMGNLLSHISSASVHWLVTHVDKLFQHPDHTPQYALPHNGGSSTTNITLNQNNNITSTNPTDAANQITDNTKKLIHNMGGMVK